MNRYKSILSIFLCLSLVFSVTGCTIFKNTEDNPTVTGEPTSETPKDQTGISKEDAMIEAARYMDNMTISEKVGQMFVLNLEQLDTGRGSYYEWKKCSRQMRQTIDECHVGGIILFSRNISTRKQTGKLIRKLQKTSQIPLFVTVDEEGGEVARIGSNPDMKTTIFPTAEQIGEKCDADYVYDMGTTIGRDIKKLGFNVDFAPVADVKTSELNTEIGTRSFGDNPEKVADLIEAFINGIQSQNVSATLKHFPGQGSSSGDTHLESVNIDSTIATLRKVDFVPFKRGIDAGADFVMVSHISVSKVTETSEPASMSELMMQTILRQELGFEGIIITDAMDMASITDSYTPDEAAVNAINGGADIILMPADFQAAYNAVLDAVLDGTISEDRIDESVLRILTVKIQRGIMTDLEYPAETEQPASGDGQVETPADVRNEQ